MKLPKFLFNYVVKHQTSLGDNLAFPPEEDYAFDYKILKQRLKEVDTNAKNIFGDDIDVKKAHNLLSQYLTDCQKLEEPVKEQLTSLCENTINKLFSIPKETIELNVSLQNTLTPNKAFRLLPEESDKREFDFEDLNEMSDVNKVVLKRRFINSLIQGGSYRLAQLDELYSLELNKINPHLLSLYIKIVTLNDFLLFNKKEKITDKHPKQGAIVEVELGREGEKTIINVQGTNFIFLLTETIRGFLELFASHGLPQDNKKATYIINQADFLLAEPWDLRMGVKLWDIITNKVVDTKIIPYYFTKICEMPVDEFNKHVQEILAKTKKGNEFIEEVIKTSEKEYEMMNIHSFIQDKNDNETLINDSYFTPEELDDNSEEIIEEEYFTEEELSDPENEENDETSLINTIVTASWNQIDFKESEIDIPSIGTNNKHLWELQVVVDDIEIPTRLVSLWAESVYFGNKMFYQLHIRIDEKLRRKGVAFKLYKSFINIFGHAISLYKNRTASFYAENDATTTNDAAIGNLWKKLGDDPTIKVQTVKKAGEPIGVIGFKQG